MVWRLLHENALRAASAEIEGLVSDEVLLDAEAESQQSDGLPTLGNSAGRSEAEAEME